MMNKKIPYHSIQFFSWGLMNNLIKVVDGIMGGIFKYMNNNEINKNDIKNISEPSSDTH